MEYLDLVLKVLALAVAVGLIFAIFSAIIMTIYEVIKNKKGKKDNQLITKEEFKKYKPTLDNLKDLD